MKKLFKRLGWFSIPIIVIGALLALWIFKPIILSQYLTSRLEVRVLVGSIDLGREKTIIGDFKIKNPYGYKTANAFKAAKTSIEYQLKKLFGPVCEIDLIAIEDAFLSVEFDGRLNSKNNWTQIIEKMPTHARVEKELIIHKLTVERLKIEIRGLGLGGSEIKTVDYIELNEIDSDDGFPTKQLIEKIFGGAGIQEYIQGLLNPTNSVKKLFNPLGTTPLISE